MNRTERTALAALVAVALAVRGGALMWAGARLSRDVDSYLRLARELAASGCYGFRRAGPQDGADADRLNTASAGQFTASGLSAAGPIVPTAYRPPLYPLLLAPLIHWGAAGVAALHLLCGLATVLLVWAAGRDWGLGPAWSLLAAALTAVDPLLLYYSTLPMSETLAALLLAVVLCSVGGPSESGLSWRSWLSGLALGLAMLCRTTFWAFGVLAAATCLAAAGPWPSRLKRAGALIAVAWLVQLPWAARNWWQLGRPVLTTTHGGYTLLLGNNHVFYDRVVSAGWSGTWDGGSLRRWQGQLLAAAHRAGADSELAYDAFCYRRAWSTIRARPADFLSSTLLRVVRFWRLYPHAIGDYGLLAQLGSGLFYGLELVLLAAALTARATWRWPWMVAVAALAAFTAVHAVYWSEMRMRAPVMPAVALLAAAGARRLALTCCRSGPLDGPAQAWSR